SSRRRHTRFSRDWSSDVCSSDLFVGDASTSAWALTTREGIILIDAGFQHNVEGTIVGGLRKLGLKPEDIRYVIVSHGHNDHFGRSEERRVGREGRDR